MVEMVVPVQVMLGERATLQCIFDMEGEELYSVKWYKAGHEFFRYIPGDRDQRISTFNLPGITVEVRWRYIQSIPKMVFEDVTLGRV